MLKVKTASVDKIIRVLFYILFFFTPLIMAPFTSELFEFNKMMFIYVITVLILFLWLLKIILLKKITVGKNVLFFAFLFFLLTQIASYFFSIDRHTSFFGYYGRFNGGLLSMTAYITLAFIFAQTFDKKSILRLLTVSLVSSLMVMLWGIPGKFGKDLTCFLFVGQFKNSCWTDQFRPHERMFSTLGQPNWLGAYLAIHFFIGLYFYLRSKNKLPLLYLFATFSSILFTRSRSSLMAVVIGVAAWVFFFQSMRKKVLILVGTLFISILLFKTGSPAVDRFMNPQNYFSFLQKTEKAKTADKNQKVKGKEDLSVDTGVTTSSDIRKIVWQGALELGKKYPMFGTGVETFAYSYYFERPKEHNMTSEWDYLYNKAHNEYLNFLATTGFIGLG